MTPAIPPPDAAAKRAINFMAIALAIIPINTLIVFLGLWVETSSRGWAGFAFLFFVAFSVLAVAQFALGVMAVVLGVTEYRKSGGARGSVAAVVGALAAIGAPAGWLLGSFGMALLATAGMGGAWGRPLRVRGRQLHPELREGSDWTAGERPDPGGLDPATRQALAALWLHDAQKEHASVPAFSRISWLLAAVGAPADLLDWAHRAAREEIAHTRLCFALAAGYEGRSHTVEPMPELLLGELGATADPLVTLATESLSDGCQLEDFNADVAAECARVCEEPVTRAVLQQIAREERSHADFSWALLAWLVERHRARVEPAIDRALATLDGYPSPTAVSADNAALVARADADLLLRHGRLPDARWGAIWAERLEATRQRTGDLLARAPLARAVTMGGSAPQAPGRSGAHLASSARAA